MEEKKNIVSLIQEFQLVILLTLITSFSILHYFHKVKRSSKISLPPSPPKLPIIGHIHLLRSSPHKLFRELSMKYGPVMLLKLGRYPTVIVSSAEAAKHVMKTYDTECASRPPLLGIKTLTYNGLDVAFSPYNDHFREVKKLFLFELLGKHRTQDFATARECEVDRLMELITKSNSSPVKLDDLFFALLDGITGTVAFGRIYGVDHFKGPEFKDLFLDVTDVLGSRSAEDLFPFPVIGQLIDKLTGLAALRTRTFHKLDSFFESIIDKHCDPGWCVKPGQEDVVDVLLRNLGNQLGCIKLTKDHIKAFLFDIYAGSINTSALMLEWTFTEIIRNPHVLEKVQNEVRNAIGNNKKKVEAEDLVRLPYLKMVINEALRLHPANTLLLPRIATAPINIGGYNVPMGTMIHVNVWAIGRDPNVWENPEEFYPERFETAKVNFRGSHFEFTPFGAGKRMCPGFPMAMATVELVLANLLYRFNWELPHGMTVNDLSMEETGTAGSISFRRTAPLELVPTIYNPM